MAQLMWTGQLALDFHFLRVSFTAEWANPMWSALEFQVSAEAEQISDMIGNFAHKVPTYNVTWGKLNEGALHTVPQRVLAMGKHLLAQRRAEMDMARYRAFPDPQGGWFVQP